MFGLIKPKEKKDAPAMDYKAKTFKKGILTKEGGNFRTMKKRYFIAKRDSIFYFELPKNFNEATAETADELQFTKELCCGAFQIIGASVTKSDKKKLSMLIQPKNDKRSYLLCALSEKDLASWIDLLTKLSNPNFVDVVAVASPVSSSPSSTPTKSAFDSKPLSKSASFAVDSPKQGAAPSSPVVAVAAVAINKQASPTIAAAANKPASPTVAIGNSSGSFREGRSPMAEPIQAESPRPLDIKNQAQPQLQQAAQQGNSGGDQDSKTNDNDQDDEGNVADDAPSQSLEESSNKRQALISEEDEFDIALCSAEIFLKSEADRSPEEKAYVLAMQQYRQSLKEHIKKTKGVSAEYSLASGSLIFTISPHERTEAEQEFVKDISELYVRELMAEEMSRFNLPIDLQAGIVKRAAEIFTIEEKQRTAQEKAYVEAIHRTYMDLSRLEHKHGLEMQHSLLSSTLMMSKYGGVAVVDDLALDDIEYFAQVME